MEMWSKKKLEVFVILSILTAAVLTTLKVIVFVRYRTGALLMLVSSAVKALVSYSNTHRFDFKIRYVFVVASLSFLGTCLGMYSYYHKGSSTSYAISSNLQYIFTAAASMLCCGSQYSFVQYFGLLMVLTGFLVEVSLADTISEVPLHTLLGALSGMFNAASLIVFEARIKPLLVNFKSFWNYMTAYGIYLTIFSSFHVMDEVLRTKMSYVDVLRSPIIYCVLLLEMVMTYILSEVSLFLDSVERATLFNVSTGFSAVVSDVYLSHEIDVQRFLGFSFVVIGVQLFNFFGRKQ